MPQFPEWILEPVKANKAGLRRSNSRATAGALAKARLHTVCDEALCPNKGQCFAEGEATFLILGDICTRTCRFCAVSKKTPLPPDPDEPRRIGELSAEWRLKYVVFTSPTRDDLPDGGASHFAAVTRAIKSAAPDVRTEPLIPDLKGDISALETVLNSSPDVLGHNIETVPSLYKKARAGADYARSLTILQSSKRLRPDIYTKSGLMLGLGETAAEVQRTLEDLHAHDCDILTLGQYISPSKEHLPVERFITPEEFSAWGEKARQMGFKAVLAGPLVRSSYRASQLYREAKV